jgi:hypothetical protein
VRAAQRVVLPASRFDGAMFLTGQALRRRLDGCRQEAEAWNAYFLQRRPHYPGADRDRDNLSNNALFGWNCCISSGKYNTNKIALWN